MMSDNEIWDILKILAALLHMGNIKYKGKVIDNLDATDIPDHSNVERVAAILGVGKQSLVDALTSRTIFAQVRCELQMSVAPNPPWQPCRCLADIIAIFIWHNTGVFNCVYGS